MRHIDFYTRKKRLHNEICEAIRELMNAHKVKEVNRVYLDEEYEVLVDSPELCLADKEFYLQHNRDIVLCTIDGIYESVYQVLEQGK